MWGEALGTTGQGEEDIDTQQVGQATSWSASHRFSPRMAGVGGDTTDYV